MALASAVQGARRPSQAITWTDLDGDALNLTGATLSGRIQNVASKVAQDIDGSLVVTDAVHGVFRWDYGSGDVAAAGTYLVQFIAAFGTDPSPAKTIETVWEVQPSF